MITDRFIVYKICW